VLGLRDGITGCLFDLDGVLTDTARLHARAWKQVFEAHGQPFDEHDDYDTYVDGKPREDGIRDFLNSRGVHPSESEIAAIGDEKNELILKLIRDVGVSPFPGSVRYLKAAKEAGLRRACVSSSHNTHDVLEVTGLLDDIEEIVDGNLKDALHLRGKPAPDAFLEGAKRLNLEPAQCAVFEDALAGVAAGRAGSFGYVVGVDRAGQRQELLNHGADIVVDDLAELLE
jgi:beta-phosphoglucomutase family hydrolase